MCRRCNGRPRRSPSSGLAFLRYPGPSPCFGLRLKNFWMHSSIIASNPAKTAITQRKRYRSGSCQLMFCFSATRAVKDGSVSREGGSQRGNCATAAVAAFVATARVRDLLLGARHLFVAAIARELIALRQRRFRQPKHNGFAAAEIQPSPSAARREAVAKPQAAVSLLVCHRRSKSIRSPIILVARLGHPAGRRQPEAAPYFVLAFALLALPLDVPDHPRLQQ